MIYYLIYILFYPFLKIASCFRTKKQKNLIIQTSAIGDYVNSSVIFELAKPFDIVLKQVNLNFADYDERIINKYSIDFYKKSSKKYKLAFKLFFNNYEKIFVLMPNDFNLFLAKFAFCEQIITISHYKNSSAFKFLSKNAKIIQHTKNDLTLNTYLSMFKQRFTNQERKIQKPFFLPKNNLIDTKKFKIGISLSAGNDIKTIIPQTWEKVFDILREIDCEIFIFGLEKEKKFLDNLNTKNLKITSLLGKIELKELPFYTSKMNLYISSDTGNYYIADCMNVPTICFMGPCYKNEQRGVYKSLIISSDLEPITAVFDTKRNVKCYDYFIINEKDENKIRNFIKELQN